MELETGSQIFNFKLSIILCQKEKMATERKSRIEGRGEIRKKSLWELKELRIYFETIPLIP